MKLPAALYRRLHWLNLPGAFLIALLQRTPVVRVAASAADVAFASSPVSAVLKAAATTLGALGAVHSMAGATLLVPSTPAPGSGKVGVTFPTIAFTVSGAQTAPASFTIGGSVLPGLTFKPLGSAAAGVSSGIVNGSTIQLDGTPTAAGQFTISLRAWEKTNGTGDNTTFFYTVNIAAADNTAPTISTQPTSKTVSAGGTVQFTAAASGSPTPTLQWFRGGTSIAGATTATLTISGASAADAATYTLVATNSLGSAASNAVTLTVTGIVANPPVVVSHPLSVTGAVGGAATFTVVATGSPTFQWRKNGTNIPGATTPTLTFASLVATDTASYDVLLTNAGGTTFGGPATLLVTAPLTARLSNLAVRTTLAANQLLTVGFTMSGGSKDVLIRAAGPGLGALGVPGTMADPKLALFNGSTQINANDNWAGNATVSAAMAAVGAFPFAATTSLDAALVTAIDGGRTAQVSGPAAGNVIVEVYDTVASNSPRLTNLSALNFVGTGGDLLIAGFTVAGTGSKNLLIRAVGPSLGALGVPGTLADPKLVVQTSGQVVVAENDTYAASLANVFTSVGAFGFQAGAKDAAVVVSLPPGGYTVTVSGADGGTGTAIVEVYELP
jgi:hypothetical protein